MASIRWAGVKSGMCCWNSSRTRGKTVFINSHLLSELEMVCDRVAILVRGQVARQGTLDELSAARYRYELEVIAEDPTTLRARLMSAVKGDGWLPHGAGTTGGTLIDRGKLAGGQWVEIEGPIVRVGITEPAEMQPLVDAVGCGGIRASAIAADSAHARGIVHGSRRRRGPGAQRGGEMTQTIAIFFDAYRDLSARRLFWITLIFSAVSIGVFGLLGVSNNELTFLSWHESTGLFSAMGAYREIFSYVVVGIWLILDCAGAALISTAGIFPDLLTGGTIELYLARLIGRFRLFATKYAAGLLFVTLQVTVFTAGSFIVFGVRVGQWNPRIFLAIPLIVGVFSYLFALSVLFGVWMRSTIADAAGDAGGLGLYSAPFWSDQALFTKEVEMHVARMGFRHQHSPKSNSSLDRIHQIVMESLVVLPKIVPTSRLLDRYLMSRADLMADLNFWYTEGDTNAEVARRMGITEADVTESISRATGGDPAYTLGSSLIFEARYSRSGGVDILPARLLKLRPEGRATPRRSRRIFSSVDLRKNPAAARRRGAPYGIEFTSRAGRSSACLIPLVFLEAGAGVDDDVVIIVDADRVVDQRGMAGPIRPLGFSVGSPWRVNRLPRRGQTNWSLSASLTSAFLCGQTAVRAMILPSLWLINTCLSR